MSRFNPVFGCFLAVFAASCATLQEPKDSLSSNGTVSSSSKPTKTDIILWTAPTSYPQLQNQLKSLADLGYAQLLVERRSALGGEADFKSLVDAAHKTGLKVLSLVDIDAAQGRSETRLIEAFRQTLDGLNQLGVDGYVLRGVGRRSPDFYSKALTSDLAGDKTVIGHVPVDSRSYGKDLAAYEQTDTMKLFDFPLRSSISDAFSIGGSLASLVEVHLIDMHKALPAAKAITFVDDPELRSDPLLASWQLDATDQKLATGYILGRNDGSPLVYGADEGSAKRPWLEGLLRFHNTVQGEPLTIVAAETCLIAFQRGTKGFIGINKCGVEKSFSIDGLYAEGTRFTELERGAELVLSAASSEIRVPPRSFVIFTVRP